MTRLLILFFTLNLFLPAHAQVADSTNEAYLKKVVSYLASDELGGRGNNSTGLYKAATFISKEMRSARLKYFPEMTSYFVPFLIEDGGPEIVNDSAGNKMQGNLLLNVVGVLEGNGKPGEAIIFSAHYDHVGRAGGIHHGANDNASGVSAMMAIMHHYSITRSNERTLVFCAFAGEEIGLLGSKAFSELIAPEAIKAVVNLEMLGETNAAGKKSLMVTGAEYSDLFSILERNLKGSGYSVLKDRSRKNLFMRSDNYSFVPLGIPSHTIMTSDDDHPCYHLPCDKANKLDYKNMVEVVKAIILATSSIVLGIDTPALR